MDLHPYSRRVLASALAALSAGSPACSTSSRTTTTEQHDGSHPGTPPTIPPYPGRSVVTTKVPIKLPGSAGVSDTGAATYDLPLQVPDGPNGLAPSLSLVYRGGGANGHLGSGFRLAGLSTIAGCNQTFASEGRADGVDLDASDSYCIDGEKLVEYADPNHPATATEKIYHTEIESFARIIAEYDAAHVQPIRFTVHDRIGLVHTYRPRYAQPHQGVSERELRVGATRLAFIYLLERTVDASGNRIDYAYETIDAVSPEVAYRISKIDYSYANGSTPRRSIKFGFASRPDPFVRYARGIKLVNRSLLTSIAMSAPNPNTVDTVWTYHLRYTRSTDTGDSLLQTVQLCAQLGACSYVRRFTWTDTDDKPSENLPIPNVVAEFDDYSMARSQDYLDAYFGPPTQNWMPASDVRLVLFDVDGDGDDDALYRTRPTLSSMHVTGDEYQHETHINCAMGKLALRRTTSSGPLASLTDVSYDFENNTGNYNSNGCPANGYATPFKGMQVANLGKSRIGDFNHDGTLDLQLAKTLIEPNDEVLPDGTLSIAKWTYGYQTSSWDPTTRWDFPAVQLPDADIAMYGPALLQKLSWNGDYGYYDQSTERHLLMTSPPFQRVEADLDGDGKVEAIDAFKNAPNILDHADIDWTAPFAQHDDNHPYETKLSSSGLETSLQQSWSCSNGRARVVDLHGDGRSDVLVTDDANHSGTYRSLAIGDGAPHGLAENHETSELWAGDCGPEGENNPDLVMGDWNGDGLVDALYPPGSRNGNTDALVRWNLGNGFGPLEVMPVTSPQAGISAADLRQDAPLGRDNNPVPWDRGTRTADVNNDGRTDIIAYRQDNDACITIPLVYAKLGMPYDFKCKNRILVFISNGSSFKAAQKAAILQGANLGNGFTTAQIGDVTGDGAIDLVYVGASSLNPPYNGELYVTELPWRWVPDRLASVHDDSTPFPLEEFTYSRNWWGDGERPAPRDGGCPYPLQCNYRGFSVVREHRQFAATKLDGTPKTRTFLHQYRGFYADQRGRGGLGVAEHRIWDREQGIETKRYFDNDTRIDPGGSLPGGEFYPGAHQPSKIVTITPLAPLPTAIELAQPTATPGLAASVPVRVMRTTFERELRHTADGRILTILPLVTTTHTGDKSVTLDPQAALPSYGDASMPAAYVETRTTATHDDHGNATEIVVETTGGLVRRTTATYVDDLVAWRLGLEDKLAIEQHDADDLTWPTRITRKTYDGSGRVLSIATSAQDATSEHQANLQMFTYDGFGNVASTTLTAPNVVEQRTNVITYDAEGVYVVATTDPYGASEILLRHPALGTPIYTRDPRGVEATAVYDPFGRMVAAIRESAPPLTQTYTEIASGDHRGFEIRSTFSDGRELVRRTDELGHVISTGDKLENGQWWYRHHEVDALGHRITAGRPTTLTTPWSPTRTVYDRLGRLLSTVRGDGAAISYQYAAINATSLATGRLETLRIDAEQHRTFVTHDLGGRVIRSGHRLASDYGVIIQRYGPFDQIEQVTDQQGNVTKHHFDAHGRRTELEDPDTGSTIFAYNGFGELVSRTDPDASVTTMTYDRLGRLVESTSSDGTLTHEYGLTGPATGQEIHSVSADGVDVETKYDAHGRVKAVRQTIDNVTDTIEQTYDGFGRLRFRFYPQAAGYDRFATYLQYGGAGELSSIEDVASCQLPPSTSVLPQGCTPKAVWRVLDRNADGAVRHARLGTQLEERRAYDAITTMLFQVRVERAGTTLATMTYDYDRDDLMTERTNDDFSESFEHDDLHRLTAWELHEERTRTRRTGYAYDALGNLLTVHQDSSLIWSGTYGATGPHALAEVARTTQLGSTVTAFSYDARGRQLTAGGRVTTWTAEDQPRTVADSYGEQRYAYGPANERVWSESEAATVTYVGKLYERHIVAGQTRHSFFVLGERGVIAQMSYADLKAQMRYLVSDGLGSTSLVLDDTSVTERAYFAPFGGRVDTAGDTTTDPDRETSVGFSGHEEDLGELINMNGRIYDIAQYRFISPDPVIGNPLYGQNHNPYSYVLNSPLYLTDPSGFDPPDVDGPGGDGGGSGNGAGGSPYDGTGYIDYGDDASDGGAGQSGGGVCGNQLCGSGGSTGSGRHADEPTYQPPVSYASFLADSQAAGFAPTQLQLSGLDAYRPGKCYVPGREPAIELTYVADQPQAGWGFGAPEWDGAGAVIRAFANRGVGQRLAESTAAGIQLVGTVELSTTRMGQMILFADLAGADPRYTAAAAMVAGRPTLGPRWLKTPTRVHQGAVFQRQGGACWACGVQMTRKVGPRQMNLDHPNAFASHGPIHPRDAIGLCRTCNLAKSDDPLSIWSWLMGVTSRSYRKKPPHSY